MNVIYRELKSKLFWGIGEWQALVYGKFKGNPFWLCAQVSIVSRTGVGWMRPSWYYCRIKYVGEKKTRKNNIWITHCTGYMRCMVSKCMEIKYAYVKSARRRKKLLHYMEIWVPIYLYTYYNNIRMVGTETYSENVITRWWKSFSIHCSNWPAGSVCVVEGLQFFWGIWIFNV